MGLIVIKLIPFAHKFSMVKNKKFTHVNVKKQKMLQMATF